MAEPTFKEKTRAMLDVSYGMSLTLATSLTIAIVRLCIVMSDDGDIVEATGLFTPWFTPWFLVLLTTVAITLRGPEIESRAKKLAADRLRERHSKLY